MKKIFKLIFVVFIFTFFIFTTKSAEAAGLTAGEIVDKANLAYYYGGSDGRAEMKMTITDSRGRERIREMVMLRKDLTDGGEQKFYVFFKNPPDVNGMVFMVLKRPGGTDDRWLYIPAVDLVKRVASKDKRSSFAGSHFTYEDVSGRDTSADTHELLGLEKLGVRDVYLIKNTPKNPDLVEFSFFKVWIDKENFLPLKGEYFDKKGNLQKTVTVDEVEVIDGIASVLKGKVAEVGRGSTVVEFKNIRYNLGFKDKIFTERSLRKPPRKWLK
ncbi:MAG: outer membrane lipoprotein-sorting protein [Deltaproteobacteria bacterium]|nr:outer membrane lipoprotein-sorting protein [Deltaproteobacteria bacterium]